MAGRQPGSARCCIAVGADWRLTALLLLLSSSLRRVGKQIVNVPSFTVRVDSQKHIDFALNSPFGGGRPGRVKRRSLASKKGGDDGGDDEE